MNFFSLNHSVVKWKFSQSKKLFLNISFVEREKVGFIRNNSLYNIIVLRVDCQISLFCSSPHFHQKITGKLFHNLFLLYFIKDSVPSNLTKFLEFKIYLVISVLKLLHGKIQLPDIIKWSMAYIIDNIRMIHFYIEKFEGRNIRNIALIPKKPTYLITWVIRLVHIL